MQKPNANIEDMLSAMMFSGFGSIPFRQIADQGRSKIKEIKIYDPIDLASCFGALLMHPQLQSSCLRLEALVHLSLMLGSGKRKPSDGLVRRLFSRISDDMVGRYEDPAEDVFVTSVSTPRGNFRIVEGVWESAGFYLQRVMNILERMPATARNNNMKESVYALLKLSDVLCERALLSRNQLGSEVIYNTIPSDILSITTNLRCKIEFTDHELNELNISRSSLDPFLFDMEDKDSLLLQSIGYSKLERCPVIGRSNGVSLILPTAVSVAIRYFVFEEIESIYPLGSMADALAQEYRILINDMHVFDEFRGPLLNFRSLEEGMIAGGLTEIDDGRYLNLIFTVDNLRDFGNGGLSGTSEISGELGNAINDWSNKAYEFASGKRSFKGLLTLVVGCGYGRGAVCTTSFSDNPECRVEFISAADLLILSHLPDFGGLALWRLLDDVDRLKKFNVELHNVNGLLNLVAWHRHLDGHLVPHGQIPDEFVRSDSAGCIIMVEQNGLRRVRHEALSAWDAHAVRDLAGKWVNVWRDGREFFAEDKNRPFYYTDMQPLEQWPTGVYETAKRSWWIVIETKTDISAHWAKERFMMVKTWICRIVPVLEELLVKIPEGPVCLKVAFSGSIGDSSANIERNFLSYEETIDCLSTDVSQDKSTVSITADANYERAFYHPDNIAERALVDAVVSGFSRLFHQAFASDFHDRVVDRIIGDKLARQSHALMTNSFRDYVRDSVHRRPVKIYGYDSSGIKLGLGWRVRGRDAGGAVSGKRECTAFLNSVVRCLEDDLCAELRGFNKVELIKFALLNHESAVNERDVWKRTSAAVLSLHDDRNATLQTMAEHDFELNAVFQASRLLVEFAVCESSLEGGKTPGSLDLARLMGHVLLLAGLGGWSDAIYWDAMEPHLRVTPLGDIHAETDFQTNVLTPFGRIGSDIRVLGSASSYGDHFKKPDDDPKGIETLDKEFLHAVEEEFGVSLQTMLSFIEILEGVGLKEGNAVFEILRSDLICSCKEAGAAISEDAEALIKRLTFFPRNSWRCNPEGCSDRDRQPWRFRRPLSVLRRPIVQVSLADDPLLIVAPGILRDALVYMLGNYYRGDFPLIQLKPKMKRWAGFARDRSGNAFTKDVNSRLVSLGWTTEVEIKITKLLRKSFDKDYGDVDVLAWNDQKKRVLIIECKDVQYKKIDGEIAEQLADFRGELRSDGKPDLLLKHLRRVDLINSHLADLEKFIKINDFVVESHLVFKNPVPMQFALSRIAGLVKVSVFDDIENI